MKRRAQPWLGTIVEISIAEASDGMLPDDNALNDCFNDAFAAIAEIHRLMSFHELDSDVSRLNLADAGMCIALHPHTHTVLQTALTLGVATAGVFDIGCASRLVEWGYLPALQDNAPDCRSMEHRPAHVALVPDGTLSIRKIAPLWIDLGGIAKGYAVDCAIAALMRHGVRSACVNAGGDLRVFGDQAFAVTVRDPASPTGIGTRLRLRNEAMATSANYFSSKRIGDRSYSALVHGQSRQPITSGISASVRAPTCMIADALTKVVLATEDARHPVLRQFGADAFII